MVLRNQNHRQWAPALMLALCALLLSFGPALAHDPADTIFPLETFSIITDGGIDIRGRFSGVVGSNFCSRNGDIRLGYDARTQIPEDADQGDTNGDVIATNGTIYLEKQACVGHTRGTVVKNNPKGCAVTKEDPAMACPDAPLFPTFNVGTQDIICPQRGVKIIDTPGDYRDLIIEPYGTCQFVTQGTYNFRRIVGSGSGNAYNVNFNPVCDKDAGYTVNVDEFVYLPEHGSWNQSGSKSVRLNVKGSDRSYGGENGNPKSIFTNDPVAFFYKGDGQLNACWIHVPNGTILVKGHLTTNTPFYGKYFQMFKNLGLTLGANPDFLECCFGQVFDCACLRRATFDQGQVTVQGMNFNAFTVKKLFLCPSSTFNALDPVGSGCSECLFTINDATEIVFDPTTCAPAVGSGDYHVVITNSATSFLNAVLTLALP